MATVVVAFVGTAGRSSTPSDSLVTSASVRSGTISETEPTRVVLPTPKPPAMTIFVDAALRAALVGAKSTEGPLDEFDPLVLRRTLGDGGLHQDEALLHQVAEQDADDPDRHGRQRGDLRDRPPVAQLEDPQRGDSQVAVRARVAWSDAHGRLHGEIDSSLRPPGRDGVRPDEPGGCDRLIVRSACVFGCHSWSWSGARRNAGLGLHRPAHALDEQCHLVPDLADV